jgi:Predicted permease.
MRVVTGESLVLALAGVVLAAGVSAVVLVGLDTAFSGLVGSTPIFLPRAFTGAIAAGGVLIALAFSALPAWRILRFGISELAGMRD